MTVDATTGDATTVGVDGRGTGDAITAGRTGTVGVEGRGTGEAITAFRTGEATIEVEGRAAGTESASGGGRLCICVRGGSLASSSTWPSTSSKRLADVLHVAGVAEHGGVGTVWVADDLVRDMGVMRPARVPWSCDDRGGNRNGEARPENGLPHIWSPTSSATRSGHPRSSALLSLRTRTERSGFGL